MITSSTSFQGLIAFASRVSMKHLFMWQQGVEKSICQCNHPSWPNEIQKPSGVWGKASKKTFKGPKFQNRSNLLSVTKFNKPETGLVNIKYFPFKHERRDGQNFYKHMPTFVPIRFFLGVCVISITEIVFTIENK